MAEKRANRSLAFFLFLCFAIFFFDRFGLLNPLKGIFEEKIIIPLRLKLINSSPEESLSPLDFCQQKDGEIASLKAQVATLKAENLASRKLLGAPLPADWRFSPAVVIGISQDEMIVDKGESAGIREGMIVLAEGFFLGKVEKVSEKIASVKLLSSVDSKSAVKIMDQETLSLVGKGLLVGKGEGKMEIRETLAEEEVKEGDLVMSLDGPEAANLPIGRITAVSFTKGEIFKTSQVKREIGVENLETVFLVTGKI